MPLETLFDGLVQRLILWAVPRWVKPNHLTLSRLVLTPLAAVLYLRGHIWLALVVFAAAALLDLVDGALARTRGPVTRLGLLLDPLADKLLVGLMLFCVDWSLLVVKVMLVLVGLELASVMIAYVVDARTGLMARANIFGKVKMWLQSLGVGLLLLSALLTQGSVSGSESVRSLGSYLLWAGLAFALASAVAQARQSSVWRFVGHAGERSNPLRKPKKHD